MHCLGTEVGGVVCSGTPGRRYQLYVVNSDKIGSCSHLKVGLRCTRASYGISKDTCNMFMEVAGGSAIVEEARGGWSMSSIVCPLMPKLIFSRCSIISSY